MKLKYRPNGSTISMSARHLADSISIAGRKLPCFSHLLSATHVVGVAQSTTQALADMDSHSPKHVERWSQPSQVWMESGKYELNH